MVILDLSEIILMIKKHHRENRDHGINCACMDEWIRELRRATSAIDSQMQSRIDYVIRAAIDR